MSTYASVLARSLTKASFLWPADAAFIVKGKGHALSAWPPHKDPLGSHCSQLCQ